MKKTPFIILLILSFLLEAGIVLSLIGKTSAQEQDTVAINEVHKSVYNNFGDESKYSDILKYSIVDEQGNVLYKNAEGLSESLNEAVKNSDTILDLDEGNKIIIHNEVSDRILQFKNRMIICILAVSLLQLILVASYFLYIKKTVTDPFKKMNEFAVRVAGGDLDIPLELDRGHAFGAFTESFDLMRSELKRSKAAEKKANDDKKEMVAKLSHDIKTPIASIKSTSEIGYEITGEDRTKELFNSINIKADQITALADNLFHSSVQDITEIDVNPSRYESSAVKELLGNSDYLGRAGEFEIPQCNVYIDRLRLQQAFDNVFMNSYKYANTDIYVKALIKDGNLLITVGDHGPGVPDEEIPLLKEKYRRGSNASEKEGAGLGLYLADYFLNRMNGSLKVERPAEGFAVTFGLRIV